MPEIDPHRIERTYGRPEGRPKISTRNLERFFVKEKTLDEGGGRGAGGLNQGVYLVKHRKSSVRCVYKKIVDDETLEREILFLQALRHPNIVKYIDAFITEDTPKELGLYMEFCDCGSLQDLLDKYVSHNKAHPPPRGNPPALIPESFIWHVFHSMANALQYIHHGIRAGDHRDPPEPLSPHEWPIILHRDIKPDNIFFRTEPGQNDKALFYPHWPLTKSNPTRTDRPSSYPKVVLADFGIATAKHERDFEKISQIVGTSIWQPPEIPEWTARGEVWVIAAIALSMCRLLRHGPLELQPEQPADYNSRTPWKETADARKGIRDLGTGPAYSQEMDDLIWKCLRFTMGKRPLSYDLVVMIRDAEKELLGEHQIPLEPLPQWAFKRG